MCGLLTATEHIIPALCHLPRTRSKAVRVYLGACRRDTKMLIKNIGIRTVPTYGIQKLLLSILYQPSVTYHVLGAMLYVRI